MGAGMISIPWNTVAHLCVLITGLGILTYSRGFIGATLEDRDREGLLEWQFNVIKAVMVTVGLAYGFIGVVFVAISLEALLG